MMKPIRTSIILALGLLATAGCFSWKSMCPEFIPLSPLTAWNTATAPPEAGYLDGQGPPCGV
jgi:hypothetical protein